ncbi:MAG TPA: RidA family protein [Candidatus Thermoplasmatota archaeon]
MVAPRRVDPQALGPAVGYAHGMRAGDFLFVAGQVGGSPRGDGSWALEEGMAGQFAKATENVVAVVREAGAPPERIVEMTAFVTDMAAYRAARKEIGAAWRRALGKHYPAMTLVEVRELFEPGALVEIKAVAYMG